MVYVDVLIFLNLIVDYFLLLFAGKIIKKRPRLLRMILGSLVGALSSLYIFLPEVSLVLDILLKFGFCFLMVLVCFGFGSLKSFLRNSVTVFLTFCAYAGVMAAVWFIFKPEGMVVNNSVVYFSISPTWLVIFTVVMYFILSLLKFIFSPTANNAEKCSIEVCTESKICNFDAIIDTGNSIEDVYGKSEIIIVDKSCIEKLFGTADFFSEKLSARYRLLPCGTVMGNSFLDGVRCDSAEIMFNGKKIVLENPILAVSKMALNDGYKGIVNPKIFY